MGRTSVGCGTFGTGSPAAAPETAGGMTLHPAIFAIGIVFVGALHYDPVTLRLDFADGTTERIKATSPETCEAARRAIYGGLWRPEGEIKRAT